jgi:putative ABC transport system permease protein
MEIFRTILSPYTWKLAYRDAKPQWKTLFLYTSSVIAGVAALVAILSFRSDVLLTVDGQSRELLGADLEFRSGEVYPDTVEAFIDSIGGSTAEALEFNSMVIFDDDGTSRLSQIRAINGQFPIYGSIVTRPTEAASVYQENRTALLEESAMNQYGLAVGDTIQVGLERIAIEGALLSVPGEAAVFSLVGPRVYLHKSIIEDSGLLDRGSRVTYKRYFEIASVDTVNSIVEAFRPLAREHRIRTETVESEKEDFDEIISNLSRFLGLIAFIALLLGGLGVASAVYVYIKRKSSTVAALRCIGVSKQTLVTAFSIQIAGVGLTGALLGSLIGIGLQLYLPTLFSGLLPFDIVQQLSIQSILLGLLTGVGISVVFSILPLAGISTISPLLTLRNTDFSPLEALSNRVKISSLLFTLAVLIGVISLLTGSLITSIAFTAGLILFIILLWGIGLMLISVVKNMRLTTFSYPLRQGMANLFRPNNQTTMLITTLGMGMLLIGTLYLSQDMLVKRIDMETGDNFPDLVFYDIQSDQNERANTIIEENGGNVLMNVPIVSMRLASRKGVPVSEVRADTTLDVRGWALGREYRVTYRSELSDTETITEGEWIAEADGINSVVPISVATQIQEDLQIELGDTLGFNVQGVPVTTVVASFRDVDFQQPQPNFFVLFPTGVLEAAPQFFATTIKTGSDQQSIAVQQGIAREFPNISAIDVSVALESVQEFLGKISMAIQFMALFSIITGFIVLASSIAISRKQRTKESVLLRTLGAEKSQIGSIQTVEYALLGLLSSLAGLIFAFIASWALAFFYFDMAFVPDVGNLMLITLFVMVAAIMIGWSGSRHIFKHSPLEILRLETT